MNKETLTKNELRWYVMKCQRAEELSKHIENYNLCHTDKNLIDNFFIPALIIKPRKEENQIRNALRRFVFLRVRPSAFVEIFSQRWNNDKTRLCHYRSNDGSEVVASDFMMTRFIDACLEYGSRFDVVTQPQDIADGLTVYVRQGAFQGLEAQVMNVQYRGDGVRFSIAVKLFADGYAYVHDCQPADVIVQPADANVFSADYLERLEHSVFSILHHRVNGAAAEVLDADVQELRSLYRLRHATVRDELLSARFTALMSICATLTQNASGRTKYNKLLKRQVKNLRQQPATPTACRALAYLLAALFVSTKDPAYRTELKQLVQQQLAADVPLRQLVSIVRKL